MAYPQVKAPVIVVLTERAGPRCGRETLVALLKLVTSALLAGLAVLMVFQLFDTVFSTLAAVAVVAAIIAVGVGWWQAKKADGRAEQLP
jgi:hypothetical protein